jgi:tetratricopeptide (TPR) repeat protein
VQAGPFEIAVVGTELDVTWDPAREVLDVTLIEGRVFVSGPLLGGRRALSAGERLRVDVQGQRSEVGLAAGPLDERLSAAQPSEPNPGEAASPSPAANAEAASSKPASQTEPGTPGERAPAWRVLAADGRHREAMEAAEREGFERVLDAAPAPALLELADSARYAGRFQRARDALLRARRLGARGRSAFLLGKIAADHLGAPGDAIAWFQTYLTEEPAGGLAEQALGRLIDLQRRVGDAAGARRAAEEYLRRYPKGAYTSLAEVTAAP